MWFYKRDRVVVLFLLITVFTPHGSFGEEVEAQPISGGQSGVTAVVASSGDETKNGTIEETEGAVAKEVVGDTVVAGSGDETKNVTIEETEGAVTEETELEPAKESGFQCVDDAMKRQGENATSDSDICKTVSLQCLHDILHKVIEDPTKQVAGRDYACILINLIQRNAEYAVSISSLESNLNATRTELQTLSSEVATHPQKFIPTEKWSHVEDLQSNGVLANETLHQLQQQVQDLAQKQENATQERSTLSSQIVGGKKELEKFQDFFNATITTTENQAVAFQSALEELNEIGSEWALISKQVREIATHTSKSELGIVQKLQNISVEVSTLFSTVAEEISRAGKAEENIALECNKNISLLEENLGKKWGAQLQVVANGSLEGMRKLQHDLHLHKKHIAEEMSNATENLKTLLETPVQIMLRLENNLTGQIQLEINRATKAEAILAENYMNQTLKTYELKTTLEREMERSLTAERSIGTVLSEQRSRLNVLDDDFKAQVKVESLRAKSAEQQLSSYVNKEMVKIAKTEAEIKQTLDIFKRQFQNETTRAVKKEDALEKQINEEATRATDAELALLKNINEELKRASEKEQVLESVGENMAQKVGQLREVMNKLKEDLDAELGSKSEVINMTAEFITEQRKKLTIVEQQLGSAINQETQRAGTAELELVNDMKAVEAKALIEVEKLWKNVTERSEKLEEGIIQSFNFTGHLTKLGAKLRKEVIKNFTMLDEVVEGLGKGVATATTQMTQDMNSLRSNLTTSLLLFAEDLYNRNEVTNETLTARLEQVEGDVKKLLNPPKAQAENSSGGVFNRFLGLFGGRRNNVTRAAGGKKKGAGGKMSRSRVSDDELVDLEEVLRQEFGGEGVASRSRELGNDARAMPVFVHRSNSKVSNTYG